MAAANKEWLYPERSYTGGWADIAKILLPRDDLWQFGGEVYVGYADGSTHYQDAFGRTSSAHKYLQKKRRSSEPSANDPCGCGSGRKFKHCCKNLPKQNRPSWDVYSIRERNLMFCHEVQDILGLHSGKTWSDVQRELSDDQVRSIHKAFASLWPVDTDLVELLPRPLADTFRAVYMGTLDPRTVASTVTGWLAYFDQLVLAHPFLNPTHIRPEYSPTVTPSQHKEQMLKNVLLLLILEPYIDAGYMHLVPDPADFNIEFARAVMRMAKERTVGWEPDVDGMQKFKELALDDHRRFLKRLPEESLRKHVRQLLPELSGKEIDAVVAHGKTELAADPLALLQPIEPGEAGAQARIIKGYGLEAAMFLAALTGSAIYTDMKVHWQQLHQYTSAVDPAQAINAWRQLLDTAKAITFPIELDWRASFDARGAGKFGEMRATMRRIAEAIREGSGAALAPELASQLSQAAEAIRREWEMSSSTTRLDGRLEISVPRCGFERNDVRRLLLTFARAKDIRPIQAAFFIRI